MSSTDINIGVATTARPSSRVLKPPGGGHSNIFAEPEVAVNAPRPKYNQQNSSNMNACMGSTDPNVKVEKLREVISQPKSNGDGQTAGNQADNNKQQSNNTNGNGSNANNARSGRVPPGGFSSGGFW